MYTFRRIFLHSPGHYIAAVLIAAAAALVVLFESDFRLPFNYVNALTTGGGIVTLLGLLAVAVYFGAFDFFGYSFKSPYKRRQQSYAEYGEQKRLKRNKLAFVPYFTVGALFILAGLIVRGGM